MSDNWPHEKMIFHFPDPENNNSFYGTKKELINRLKELGIKDATAIELGLGNALGITSCDSNVATGSAALNLTGNVAIGSAAQKLTGNVAIGSVAQKLTRNDYAHFGKKEEKK